MSNADDFAYLEDIDPTPAAPRRTGKRILLGCLIMFGAVIGLLLVGVATLGTLFDAGYLPPTEVRTGEDTPEKHLERVREIGALLPDEEVLLFYSWGITDAAEGGTALTDEGVAIWYEDDALESGYEIDRIPYAAIQDAVIDEPGSLLVDTLIAIETPLSYFYTSVSTEEGGDDIFLERLLDEWEARGRHRPNQVPQSFATEVAEYFPRATEDALEQRPVLVAAGVLEEDEALHLFLTWDGDDPVADGCAVTDRGVVIWESLPSDEGDPTDPIVDRVPFAAIKGITVEERGSMFESTAIDIVTKRATYTAWVPRVHGDDRRFLECAQEAWHARGGSRPADVPSWFKSKQRE